MSSHHKHTAPIKNLTLSGTLAAAGTTLTFPSNALTFIPTKAVVKTVSYKFNAANANALTTYEVSSNLTNGPLFCFVPNMIQDAAPQYYLFASLAPNVELDLRNGTSNNMTITVRDLQGANAAGFITITIEFTG